MSKLLEGKLALVTGIANRWSLAYAVAQAYARPQFGPGDEILITALEHHANIVPWQMVRDQTGCTLSVAPIIIALIIIGVAVYFIWKRRSDRPNGRGE